jgi:hypothetical protein
MKGSKWRLNRIAKNSMTSNRDLSASAKMIFVLALVCGVRLRAFELGDKPIVDIRFNAEYSQISNSEGDEWAPTWADDGNLYTGNDDGSSFGGIGVRSVAFGKLVGDDPNNLKGITVSDLGEYGGEPARPGQGQLENDEFILRGWRVIYVCDALPLPRAIWRCESPAYLQEFEHHQIHEQRGDVDAVVGGELQQADVSRPGVWRALLCLVWAEWRRRSG